MAKPVIFSFPNTIQLANKLQEKLGLESGTAEVRKFPDGESYIRIYSEVKNKAVILLAALNDPNPEILPLMFMAQTIKELGAKNICLIAPYLPYMRQDKRFHPGEAITSALFAKFLSSWIDCLITIDPHLHRIHHLSDIYTVPSLTLHATKAIATWISHNMHLPFLIGPDEESHQWLAEIAKYANIPFVTGKKKRYGDRNVSVSLPDISSLGSIPVLVDDVISTGESMLETLNHVRSRGFENSTCIAVHALFDKETEAALRLAGVNKIITCNTIQHPSNQIDITDLIVSGIEEFAK